MKKIAKDIYSLNLTDVEAFDLVRENTSKSIGKITFAVKTYLGAAIFFAPKSFFKKASNIVGGDDKLLSLYDKFANNYFLSLTKVIIVDGDTDISNIASRVAHNSNTSTSFALANDTKDNSYFIIAPNWIQAVHKA